VSVPSVQCKGRRDKEEEIGKRKEKMKIEREPQSAMKTHSSNCSQIAVKAMKDETGCAEDQDKGSAAGSRECQLSVAIQATCGASL
jgi:hypothetical protein